MKAIEFVKILKHGIRKCGDKELSDLLDIQPGSMQIDNINPELTISMLVAERNHRSSKRYFWANFIISISALIIALSGIIISILKN